MSCELYPSHCVSGVMSQGSSRSPAPSPGLTVALPPPRNQPSPQSTSRRSSTGDSISPPPPRPPPPRASQTTPPSLPPKQYRGHSQRMAAGGAGGDALMSPSGIPLSLPPPLIPTQVNNSSGGIGGGSGRSLSPQPMLQSQFSSSSSSSVTPPPPPPRTTNPFLASFSLRPTTDSPSSTSSTSHQTTLHDLRSPSPHSASELTIRRPDTDSQEAADNASNECTVCWEKPPNCVIYTCGHMCMCFECAVDIKNNQGALCPICRQEIKDIIKIFKS
jgi:hypothetical protein